MAKHLWGGFWAVGFASIFVASLAVHAAPPTVAYRPIALSGNVPPEYGPNLGDGAIFNSFTDTFSLIVPGAPSLNQHGEVAFRAVAYKPNTNEPAHMGIWTNHGGALHPAAYGGSDVYGPNVGPDVWFGRFQDPLINNGGDVAYGAIPYGPNVTYSNMDGLWSTNGPIATPIVSVEPRTANPLSYLPAHTRFLPTALAQNNLGEVAFLGSLMETGETVDNEFALFTNQGGTLRIVAREGDVVSHPLIGPGVLFDDPRIAHSFVPAIADNGSILFQHGLRGAGINASNAATLWLNRGNGLELIARAGPAGAGPDLGGIPFSNFSSHTLNAQGDIAFLARLNDPGAPQGYSAGIWMKHNSSGPLELVARTRVPGAPNLAPDVQFIEIDEPVLNAKGEIAFRGSVQGSSVNGSYGEGIWTNVGGELRAVALGRSTATELDTGLGDGTYFWSVHKPAFNNNGDILFHAYLNGPNVTGYNDRSLWLWSGGELKMLFREGDMFDINPDPQVTELHQISGMDLAFGSAGADGRAYGLNDRGEFAVVMDFEYGFTGIFVGSIVPEPTAIWLVFAALSFLVRLQRV